MGTLELAVVGLAGSGVGTALSLPMVWQRARGRDDVRLMGAWLLSGSVIVALISARLLGLVPRTQAIGHAINLTGLVAYPLVYLYVRHLGGCALPARRAWWLWIPAAVYLSALVARAALGFDTRVPFAWMLPVVLGFTALCAAALARQDRATCEGLVPARWLVAFLALLNAAQVIRMLFGHVPLVPAIVPLVMTAGFVGLVGLVAWRAIEPGRAAGTAAAAAPRYEKSGLDAGTAAALLGSIDRALSVDRLFADSDLTLGRLAAAVGATPHQVSEVLNRHAATSFHELLNRRRVDDVKAQLSDAASDGFTIEGIGASAGFGSRSALYAVFRRVEGTTPTAYRASIRARRTGERHTSAD